MKLSFILGNAGFEPTSIDTTCTVSLDGGLVTGSHLNVTASVPGISQDVFTKCVAEAAQTCPVSKSLAIPVTHESTLKA